MDSNRQVIVSAVDAILAALNDTKDSNGRVGANQGATALALLNKAKTLTTNEALIAEIDERIANLPKASLYTSGRRRSRRNRRHRGTRRR